MKLMLYLLFIYGFVLCCNAWPLPEALAKVGYWQSLGNHRYEIRVPTDALPHAAYLVTLPWHRGDLSFERTGTVLLDALSLQPVELCRRLHATREEGQFAFSGSPGGVYHLYYMPFETCEFVGGACPYGQRDDVEGMVQYAAFTDSCNDPVWWHGNDIFEVGPGEIQSRTEFDAFSPMEAAATGEQTEALLRKAGTMLLVAETRSNPIRMFRYLPASWANRSFEDLSRLRGIAQPGEAYSFQIGVVASQNLEIHSASLSNDLVSSGGSPSIPKKALRCMNLEGVDFWGRNFTSIAKIPVREVRALWFILEVPASTPEGMYFGNIVLTTTVGTHEVAVELQVRGPVVENSGFDDLWRGSRLAWLDSRLGIEHEVPPPYRPLGSWKGRTLEMLDKVITISPEGFPSSVKVGGTEALAEPVRFEVIIGGRVVPLHGRIAFQGDNALSHSWIATLSGADVQVLVQGTVDATGYFDFNVSLDAASTHEVRLVIPLSVANSIYAAGLGRMGGLLNRWTNGTSVVDWKWDGINHNSAVWVGSTKAGIRVYPKGDDPLWQACVPFDSDISPPTPESWSNEGAGGIRVLPNGSMEVYTGVHNAQRQVYLFSLMATPTRPLDLPKHFAERYAQISKPMNFSYLRDGGATVVNLHQGNVLNPWINYPYLTNNLIKQAADECHALGMKFKLYNTMRELSNHAMELDALRMLNETFVWRGGEGGGGDWLREHLHEGYSVAWATPMAQSGYFSQQIDMAIKVNALTRWNNYYVEGLRQLIKDTGFDGIYLDEIAYDRVTMLRSKAVLGKDGLIDHHSDRGQFAKVPVMVYAEMFPFIDSLWYGEGFNYDDATPDHWLVEISGIPFGLNSDMLRYTGMTPFHFRGMLVASANRWQDDLDAASSKENAFDPRSVWKLWDSFGISQSNMYGWWQEQEGGIVPIATNSTDVKCTVFSKVDSALIVLANFGSAQWVKLQFDWNALGFSADGKRLRAPVLVPMQPEEKIWALDDDIPIPAPIKGSSNSREGWLILLEKHAAVVYI